MVVSIYEGVAGLAQLDAELANVRRLGQSTSQLRVAAVWIGTCVQRVERKQPCSVWRSASRSRCATQGKRSRELGLPTR